jgi:hypothetical protein
MFRKETVMKKNRFRLLLLAVLLGGTALLSAARPAAACNPYMCWIVDENTVCCWEEDCTLWCG